MRRDKAVKKEKEGLALGKRNQPRQDQGELQKAPWRPKRDRGAVAEVAWGRGVSGAGVAAWRTGGGGPGDVSALPRPNPSATNWGWLFCVQGASGRRWDVAMIGEW